MRRSRTKNARDRFLQGMRKQRVKTVTVLPSLISIINGICGFAAIIFTSKAAVAISRQGINPAWNGQETDTLYFTFACYMILLAMIADMLDGRLARFSHSTSSFGGQLDSLCDTISFGVAPAFLMLKILECRMGEFTQANPAAGKYLMRFIMIAAAAYVICAVIQLARFNVENEQDESAHMSFVGLPSPAAAGVLVSLVIFHQQTLPDFFTRNTNAFFFCEGLILYSLPIITVGTAILMISRIRYPHILNQYLKGKKPLAYLLWALLLLALVIWTKLAALVLIFCGFAAGSFVKWFYLRLTRKKNFVPHPPYQEAGIIESEDKDPLRA